MQDETPTGERSKGEMTPELAQLAVWLAAPLVAQRKIVTVDGAIAVVREMAAALAPIVGVAAEARPKPAVPIEESVGDTYLICLEDGRRLKLLRRYLSTRFNMTPAQYRAKWNLPPDYPMAAPSYSRERSAMARSIGLGRKPKGAGG